MDDLISRQAAIDALRTCYDTETITMDNGDEYINYEDAVGEIEQLPPAQPEPCEDAVSRKAVQYLLAHFVDEDKYVNACDGLKQLPPVTLKQPAIVDMIKTEIKRMKRTYTTCINPDYYTGYMCALSAV